MRALRRRARPSAALVVTVVALVAAYAGTSLASNDSAATGRPAEATSAAKKRQLNRKKIRRIARSVANRLITKRAPSLSVASAGSATNTVNAINARDSAALSGKSLNQVVMWATVGSNGRLARASDPRITSERIQDPGRYRVTFPINVRGCGYQVTPSASGLVTNPPRVVLALGLPGGGDNTLTYVVGTADDAPSRIVDGAANIAVHC